MKYIPHGHIKIPKMRHQWITVADLPQNVKQNVWAYRFNNKGDPVEDIMFRGNKVDSAYVKSSDVYQYNLDSLHSYIMDLYYVVSHYLTDADIAKVLNAIYGGGTKIWHQWISLDMLMSESFSNKHVKTLKCFQYILTSPRLKFHRNSKCERWFEEERINLSEVRNVFLKEERMSA